MSNATETRTAIEIAAAVYAASPHQHLELTHDELGNAELTINNYCLVINDEDEGGHTYTVWARESADDTWTDQVTTDGSTDNDGLEEFLTDWVNEHA